MELSFEIAQINDDIQLAYLDSGVPSGSEDYATLVCVHGHTYHARNFNRVITRAHAHNFRVIALNRRDYVGSTQFSQEELDKVNSKDPNELQEFLKERGREILFFLSWVVEHKAIPRAKDDGKGGLALLGWSLGNVTTLSMLAFLGEYGKELIRKLEPWLTTFFIYEVGAASVGYTIPEGGYHPLRDPSIPAPARMLSFGTWVSSYYNHPYYTNPPTSTDSSAQQRTVSGLQTRTPASSESRPCTLHRLPATELRASIDTAPVVRSEQGFVDLSLDVLTTMRHRALFANNQLNNSKDDPGFPLPGLRVRLVFGSASVWSAPWAAWSLEAELAQLRQKGDLLRDVEVVCVKGANHFMHVDEPDQFLETMGQLMRS